MQKCQRLAVVMVALTLILVSASGYADAGSKVVVDKWEIPWINTWTGPTAAVGTLANYFAKIAEKEINASGGIAGRPLEMKDCDTAMDPSRAASCIKKAVEKSLIILGPSMSFDGKVAGPIASKAGVMMVTPSLPAEIIGKLRPWAVTFSPSLVKRNNFLIDSWLGLNPKMKRVVLLGHENMAVFKLMGNMEKAGLEKRGIKVVDRIDVQVGAVDISSIVIRALGSKPDGLSARLMPGDTVRLVSELKRRGLKNMGSIRISIAADTPATYLMATAAGNILDGCYIGVTDRIPSTPNQLKLLKAFQKVKGMSKASTLMWPDLFYVGTYLLKDAIENAGVTGDPTKLKEERIKIRDYVNSIKDFDPKIFPALSIDESGSFNVNIHFAKISDSKPVIVKSMR